MPVAAVNPAGKPTVSSGSSSTLAASKEGWKKTCFFPPNPITELRPTSLPVPAVVGIATKGAKKGHSFTE